MASNSPVNFDCSPAAGDKRGRADMTAPPKVSGHELLFALRDDPENSAKCEALLLSVMANTDFEVRVRLAEHVGLLQALLAKGQRSLDKRVCELAEQVFGSLVCAWYYERATVGLRNIVLDNAELVCDLLDAVKCGLAWAHHILEDAIEFQVKERRDASVADLIGTIPGVVDKILDITERYVGTADKWDSYDICVWASGLLRSGIVDVAFAHSAGAGCDGGVTRALRLIREPNGCADGAAVLLTHDKAMLSDEQMQEARQVIAFRKGMGSLKQYARLSLQLAALETRLNKLQAEKEEDVPSCPH